MISALDFNEGIKEKWQFLKHFFLNQKFNVDKEISLALGIRHSLDEF